MDLFREVLQRGIDHLHDASSKRHALTVLAVVEKASGSPVSSAIRRQAVQYAGDVLGSRRFAPWLLVYSAMAGEFREGWIPDAFFGRVVSPRVNHGIRHVSSVKTFTRVVFDSGAIPDNAYLIDGRLFDRDFRLLSAGRAHEAVFGDSDQVVVKSDGSRQGKGVRRLSRDQFDADSLEQQDGNAVFQRVISHHPFFARYSAGFSTTMRITTVKNLSGAIEARAAYLRFARDGEDFVRSASHVRLAIDVASGRTAPVGYLSDWSMAKCHPDSLVQFEHASVPAFGAARELCITLHSRLPHVGVIGWDVMVDAEEHVWVIEWNAKHADIKFSEATVGPCFTGLGWERLRPPKRSWLT